MERFASALGSVRWPILLFLIVSTGGGIMPWCVLGTCALGVLWIALSRGLRVKWPGGSLEVPARLRERRAKRT
jgi:hypothetical protein